MRRITASVQERLEILSRRGGLEREFPFLTHRTMADPRFLDPTLEPNGRKPGWCYLGHPETVNTGPVGLARFSTLRAWLSQWSVDHSQADAEASLRRIQVPTLIIENEADDCVPPGHIATMVAAAAAPDFRYHVIAGAGHYYRGQPQQEAEALQRIATWLAERNL